MSRKGREFETLVKLIERCLIPNGAIIKSPDYIQDKITGCKREVDISIRHNIGSSPILIIIECRDRFKIEDVTWIEQIAQKGRDLNANKILAVSSKGFSEPALEKARHHGIETRIIQDITLNDVKSWFAGSDFTLIIRKIKLHRVNFVINKSSLSKGIHFQESNVDKNFKLDLNEKNFILKRTGEACHLDALWSCLPAEQNPYNNLQLDGKPERYNICLDFSDEETRYQIKFNSNLVDILQVTFFVDLWVETVSIPISKIHTYKGENQPFVDSIEYNMTVQGRQHKISFHRVVDSGAFFISSRISENIPNGDNGSKKK